jgi:hypothetical protein
MSLRSRVGRANPGSPRSGANLPAVSTAERLRDEAPVAFEHEHSRAYDAIETAAQRLELAGSGHEREVGLLRAIRRRLARHLEVGDCDGD